MAAENYEPNVFDWKWNLADLPEPSNLKVFSCFSCGGGSSMGYKRAGFDVAGCCEIDPSIIEVYKKNLHPRHPYNMDVRDFLESDVDPELYELDVLDGSPPCTTFSTAGKREKVWGVEKAFAEGQKKQRLDDLFFTFIDIARKLNPKVVIAENVTGLVKGNAKGYVSEICEQFEDAGYKVQLFVLNGAYMDVPQRRRRVFFVANRMGFPDLKLSFNHRPITFGEIRSECGIPIGNELAIKDLYENWLEDGDRNLRKASLRKNGKDAFFNYDVVYDCDVATTITASVRYLRRCDGTFLSNEDIRNMSSWPQDYDFLASGKELNKKVLFMCGMSVPPNMTANIAREVRRQWFDRM